MVLGLSKSRVKQLADFESLIGFCFPDKVLLNQSLVHRSYAHLHGMPSNERLEFLGDSVLSFSVSDFLYRKNKKWDEGLLTCVRSQLVSHRVLYFLARKFSLSSYVLVAGGLKLNSVHDGTGILGDAFESFLGAAYLSFGYEKISCWILSHLKKFMDGEGSVQNLVGCDYKSKLQILVQKKIGLLPIYTLVSVFGPEHDQIMTSRVFVDGWFSKEGTGKSKKEAEQNAARVVLQFIFSEEE